MSTFIDLTEDIHSLTDFKRSTADFLARIKETGRPLVLTVNGKAGVVVQDADAYQQLLDRLDRAEAIEAIRKGLESVDASRTRPADEAFAELRRKYDIPR